MAMTETKIPIEFSSVKCNLIVISTSTKLGDIVEHKNITTMIKDLTLNGMPVSNYTSLVTHFKSIGIDFPKILKDKQNEIITKEYLEKQVSFYGIGE